MCVVLGLSLFRLTLFPHQRLGLDKGRKYPKRDKFSYRLPGSSLLLTHLVESTSDESLGTGTPTFPLILSSTKSPEESLVTRKVSGPKSRNSDRPQCRSTFLRFSHGVERSKSFSSVLVSSEPDPSPTTPTGPRFTKRPGVLPLGPVTLRCRDVEEEEEKFVFS